MKPSFAGASSAALRSSYEGLRALALAGGRGPGFALLLHHGMREWMEVCASCTAVVAATEQVEVTATSRCVPPETRSELVSILAGLWLQRRWEVTR